MSDSIERLCRLLEEKIGEHAERGLTTSNIDLIGKLVDIYKDIKNTEYWDIKAEYYLEQLEGGGYYGNYPENRDGEDGYSGARRKRDSRGRYSREGGEGGYSYDGGRNSRGGNYSRNDGDMHERYMDAKHSYRNGGGSDCKQRLVTTLDNYMDNFSRRMEEMLRDADCAEERETIQRYLHKLRNLG